MTEFTRRLRYQVATSLDGYIANENGSYDWIIDDPTIDFGALFAEFDTLIMGRRTFEMVEAAKNPAEGEHAAVSEAGVYGKEAYVFSRTLRDRGHARIHVVRGDVASVIAALKTRPGRDLWLFGGGDLARVQHTSMRVPLERTRMRNSGSSEDPLPASMSLQDESAKHGLTGQGARTCTPSRTPD